MASGATCVQKLDGSRDSAIHTKYRILLRSSSMREPRYPLPRVVFNYKEATSRLHTANGARQDESFSIFFSLAHSVPGFVKSQHDIWHPKRSSTHACRKGKGIRTKDHIPITGLYLHVHRSFCLAGSTMILPQVHLRKPCYDFSFL